MLPWIVLFVAIDIAVVVLVVRHALNLRASTAVAADPSLLDLGKIRAFTDVIHPRVGEYVRANWSGDPEALPGVLAALVEGAEAEARAQGLAFDREIVKRVVEFSIGAHKLARGDVVREAMKRVA